MLSLREMAADPPVGFEEAVKDLIARVDAATTSGGPDDCWPCAIKNFNFTPIRGERSLKMRPHVVAYWKTNGVPLHELMELSRKGCVENCVNPRHFKLVPARNTKLVGGEVHPLTEEEILARRAARAPRSENTVACEHCGGTGRLPVEEEESD